MFHLTRKIISGQNEILSKNKNSLNKITILKDEGWKFRDISFILLKNEMLKDAFNDIFIIHIYEQNATYLSWMIKCFNEII